MWGELDNNIMADKNKPAWDTALKAAGNRDYTLVVIPRANHAMLEAKVGSNAEVKSLQRIAPSISRRSETGSRSGFEASTDLIVESRPLRSPSLLRQRPDSVGRHAGSSGGSKLLDLPQPAGHLVPTG